MKIIKIKLKNKMKDEFHANIMVICIERKIAKSLSSYSIIEDFRSLKK